jgi:hypothetical protein
LKTSEEINALKKENDVLKKALMELQQQFKSLETKVNAANKTAKQ